ncbi:MAG TPA: non-heme iron oxygenase ferredoxin subunit [Phenylobacterium sp.]|uniref:non-heme iron oxygenase ferredoxin subunit n=1 Tax=Phenylobacterium sp. TaxID=1871053 RepID=UPI002B49556D|nr:non-heme iron oxygenase ferredoxin subunit [Phenylobacterium sp.]HKR88252.1 non-heme iron oxygenase ferredoxin subunit [Phenylobacterium sp.]
MAGSDVFAAGLFPLCALADLPLEEGRCFEADGRRIAVFRLEDGVFAIGDLCTHGHGALSEGFVEAGEVECPLHAGRFDIRSGRPCSAPVEEPVAAYPVEIIDGVVHVRI